MKVSYNNLWRGRRTIKLFTKAFWYRVLSFKKTGHWYCTTNCWGEKSSSSGEWQLVGKILPVKPTNYIKSSSSNDLFKAVASVQEYINNYFDLLEETLQANNIYNKSTNIFNFDESEFPLSPKSLKVVSQKVKSTQINEQVIVGHRSLYWPAQVHQVYAFHHLLYLTTRHLIQNSQ